MQKQNSKQTKKWALTWSWHVHLNRGSP